MGDAVEGVVRGVESGERSGEVVAHEQDRDGVDLAVDLVTGCGDWAFHCLT